MHRGTQPTVLAQKTYKGCLKYRFSILTRHHKLDVESDNGNTFILEWKSMVQRKFVFQLEKLCPWRFFIIFFNVHINSEVVNFGVDPIFPYIFQKTTTVVKFKDARWMALPHSESSLKKAPKNSLSMSVNKWLPIKIWSWSKFISKLAK